MVQVFLMMQTTMCSLYNASLAATLCRLQHREGEAMSTAQLDAKGVYNTTEGMYYTSAACSRHSQD